MPSAVLSTGMVVEGLQFHSCPVPWGGLSNCLGFQEHLRTRAGERTRSLQGKREPCACHWLRCSVMNPVECKAPRKGHLPGEEGRASTEENMSGSRSLRERKYSAFPRI